MVQHCSDYTSHKTLFLFLIHHLYLLKQEDNTSEVHVYRKEKSALTQGMEHTDTLEGYFRSWQRHKWTLLLMCPCIYMYPKLIAGKFGEYTWHLLTCFKLAISHALQSVSMSGCALFGVLQFGKKVKIMPCYTCTCRFILLYTVFMYVHVYTHTVHVEAFNVGCACFIWVYILFLSCFFLL